MSKDYQPNSHKHRMELDSTDKKKVKKVVSGKAKMRKKSELSKLTGVLISEDASNVKSYIFTDVIIPAIADLIEDVVVNGIRMIIRGESGSSKKRSGSYVSYRDYSNKDRRDDRRSSGRDIRNTPDYRDIIFDNRGDAEDVLDNMQELIDTYDMVTVADLYDLAGLTGSFTDNKYGWNNIRTAKVVRVRDGYKLDLPRALVVD